MESKRFLGAPFGKQSSRFKNINKSDFIFLKNVIVIEKRVGLIINDGKTSKCFQTFLDSHSLVRFDVSVVHPSTNKTGSFSEFSHYKKLINKQVNIKHVE